FASSKPLAASSDSDCLQIDIPELDLHRRPDVDLEAEQSLQRPVLHVIVDEHSRHMPVQDVDERAAAGDHVELIPVLVLDERLEVIAAVERPDSPANAL